MGTNVLISSSRDETLENEKDQAILEENAENTRNRRDLQGIRGIAIIAVVLFHYFPAHFPNGYVGVDQVTRSAARGDAGVVQNLMDFGRFFVLSGFLMSMVTERKKRFTAREISLFYYRRSKRILPLYLLVLIGCVVITEACLFGSLHPTNWKSFYYASVFMTNIKATDSIREYNEMLSQARDFFTHTWSIAVEMQFYIIFPVLFVIYKSIYLPISKPFLVIVAVISLLFHICLPERQAFNLLQARIWQFVTGILAHQLDKTTTDAETNSKYSSLLCHRISLIATTLLSFWMFTSIPGLFLRISTTLTTAALILSHPKTCNSCLITTRCLTYIGDISYSLYLVHWPMYIVAVKLNNLHSVTGVILAVLLSVIVTETFERQSMRASKRTTVHIIICFYAIIALALMNAKLTEDSQMERTWISRLFTPTCKTAQQESSGLCDIPLTTTKLNRDEIFRLNRRFSLDDVYMLSYPKCYYRHKLFPWFWCDLPGERSPKYPQHRILIIGNSYAANQGRVVYEMCRRPDIEIKMYTLAGCEVFTITHQFWHCHNSSAEYMSVIKEYKPDVLFIILRYVNTMELPATMEPLAMESLVSQGVNVLRDFSRIVSTKIFVLQAIPRPNLGFEDKYQQAFLKKQIIDPETVINKTVNLHVVREVLERSIANCSKCEMIDYSPLFTVNGTFHFYDYNISMFNMNGYFHFTPLGLYKMRPLYKSICDSIDYSNKQ